MNPLLDSSEYAPIQGALADLKGILNSDRILPITWEVRDGVVTGSFSIAVQAKIEENGGVADARRLVRRGIQNALLAWMLAR